MSAYRHPLWSMTTNDLNDLESAIKEASSVGATSHILPFIAPPPMTGRTTALGLSPQEASMMMKMAAAEYVGDMVGRAATRTKTAGERVVALTEGYRIRRALEVLARGD